MDTKAVTMWMQCLPPSHEEYHQEVLGQHPKLSELIAAFVGWSLQHGLLSEEECSHLICRGNFGYVQIVAARIQAELDRLKQGLNALEVDLQKRNDALSKQTKMLAEFTESRNDKRMEQMSKRMSSTKACMDIVSAKIKDYANANKVETDKLDGLKTEAKDWHSRFNEGGLMTTLAEAQDHYKSNDAKGAQDVGNAFERFVQLDFHRMMSQTYNKAIIERIATFLLSPDVSPEFTKAFADTPPAQWNWEYHFNPIVAVQTGRVIRKHEADVIVMCNGILVAVAEIKAGHTARNDAVKQLVRTLLMIGATSDPRLGELFTRDHVATDDNQTTITGSNGAILVNNGGCRSRFVPTCFVITGPEQPKTLDFSPKHIRAQVALTLCGLDREFVAAEMAKHLLQRAKFAIPAWQTSCPIIHIVLDPQD